MNFELTPPARLQGFGPPDPRGPIGEDDEFPFLVFPPLLPNGTLRGLLPGQLFSKSFTLRSWASHTSSAILGYTVTAAEPGLIHIVIDSFSWAAFGAASDFAFDQARKNSLWFGYTIDEILGNTVDAAARSRPDLFLQGQDVVAVVQIPPMHLRDP